MAKKMMGILMNTGRLKPFGISVAIDSKTKIQPEEEQNLELYLRNGNPVCTRGQREGQYVVLII